MKRQELVQLHSLFAEVKEHAEDEFEMDIDTPEYDSVDVRPIGIHQTCDEHRKAALILADELATAFEEAETPTPE